MRKPNSMTVLLVVGIVAAFPLALLQLGGGLTFLIDFAVALGVTAAVERLFPKPVK
jgi:hypothetical protein